ncbi:MAG: hypothetical protein KDK28_07145 [Maritimibacter sp.]|nr:hypothetical protein [Maritimibacter sp.]
MTAPRQSYATGNALSPDLMTAAERRAELCRILALGVIRLRMRDDDQHSANTREFLLHNSAVQSGSPDANDRRTK